MKYRQHLDSPRHDFIFTIDIQTYLLLSLYYSTDSDLTCFVLLDSHQQSSPSAWNNHILGRWLPIANVLRV